MNEREKRVDVLALIAKHLRCTTCLRRYRSRDFTILEQGRGQSVYVVRCPTCNKQSLIVVISQKQSVRPIYSELDLEEWKYYKHQPPLTVDDVINIHRQMQAYEGDLSDVLEDPVLPPDDEPV